MNRLIVAVGLCLFVGSAWASDWHDTSNYPGRAVAFNFNGVVLDQNSPVRFGSWTVSFGPAGPPILMDKGGTIWTVTDRPQSAQPMSCVNTVLGRVGCFLTFGYREPPNVCRLITNDQTITIPCPTEVTFQR